MLKPSEIDQAWTDMPGTRNNTTLRHRRIAVFSLLFSFAILSRPLARIFWPLLIDYADRSSNTLFATNPDRLIEKLIHDGSLRPARDDEIQAWFNLAPRGEMEQYRDSLGTSTLVVMRPVTLPRGMYGAHSRVFLVPNGQAMPAGVEASHNTLLFMNGGGCMGTFPGCVYM